MLEKHCHEIFLISKSCLFGAAAFLPWSVFPECLYYPYIMALVELFWSRKHDCGVGWCMIIIVGQWLRSICLTFRLVEQYNLPATCLYTYIVLALCFLYGALLQFFSSFSFPTTLSRICNIERSFTILSCYGSHYH